MDVMELKDINPEVFANTKHIHISSIFMQSGLKKDLIEILKLAKENDVTTSLDTQWDPVEAWDLNYAEVLPLITVFMPNETELKALTHKDTVDEAIECIAPYINNAIIKQGSRGSLLIKQDGTRVQIPAMLNDQVVDCIGAGDSFNSGFISQLVQGKTLEACQRYGNMTGAVNTTAAGGTTAFTCLEDVERVGKERFGFEK
jgi:sugar/nucleoside kinase (ribokinase family)